MSTLSSSLSLTRKIAFATLLGASCLASPLAVAQMADPIASSSETTTTTTSTAPVVNSYNTTTSSKSVDAYGDETVKNKTYASGPDGTRATSTTEVHTPDGGSVTTTHEEHTNAPVSQTTSTRSSVSTETLPH